MNGGTRPSPRWNLLLLPGSIVPGVLVLEGATVAAEALAPVFRRDGLPEGPGE